MEGGLLKEKKGREGVLGKTALTFFYLETEQGREGEARRCPGRRQLGPRRRPRCGAKRRGAQGGSIPLPSSSGGGVSRRGDGSGQRPALAAVAVALQLRRGGAQG